MDAQKPSHVPYAELTEEEHVEHNTNIWDQDDPVKALFHKLKQEVKKQNQHKKEEHDDEKEKSPYVHPFDFTELFQFDFYRSIVAGTSLLFYNFYSPKKKKIKLFTRVFSNAILRNIQYLGDSCCYSSVYRWGRYSHIHRSLPHLPYPYCNLCLCSPQWSTLQPCR